MPIKIQSDSTSVQIGDLTLPKNVITFSVRGTFITIKVLHNTLVQNEQHYTEFVDNTNAQYASMDALVTALKTAAYAA